MAEFAYKMFNKDLTCTRGRGRYQYVPGEWAEEPEANCAHNGFHAAKNPLDCLSYYPDWDSSQCWIVEIAGDIDEDRIDSKVSCTRIRLVKQLTLEEFVAEACRYMINHQAMPTNHLVRREPARVCGNHFAIVRCEEPMALGQEGDVIGLLKEIPETGQIYAGNVFTVGTPAHKAGTWYNVYGEEVTEDAKIAGASF
jgi:hypothetical protein